MSEPLVETMMQRRRASSPEMWLSNQQLPINNFILLDSLPIVRPSKQHSRKFAWIIDDNISRSPFQRPNHSSSETSDASAAHKITDAPKNIINRTSFWGDIGIVGFKTILDSNANQTRRIIWFAVLTTCFGLMLAQTWERLSYYMTEPVSTSVRYIRNNSLLFPSVVVCPYRPTLTDTSHLDPSKLRQIFDEHKHRVGHSRDAAASDEADANSAQAMYHHLADFYDVNTLWNKTGWDLQSQVAICLQGRMSCKEGPKTVFTVLGSCLHYPATEITISGQFYGLDITLCPDNPKGDSNNKRETELLYGFYLLISDRHSTYDIRSLTHGFYLQRGWQKDISLSLKEFHAEPKKRASSSSQSGYQQALCTSDKTKTVSRCISLCFHRALVDKIHCRMPYMNMMELDAVPYCNSSQQLRLADQLQQELLWEGQGWHPASCHCDQQPTSCSQYIYETSADSYAVADQPLCVRYKIFFTDMTYEETKEEFTYDVVSLLCDIGGTLGLLLGASVLTVVQIVDSFSRQIKNAYTLNRHANSDSSTKITADAGSL